VRLRGVVRRWRRSRRRLGEPAVAHLVERPARPSNGRAAPAACSATSATSAAAGAANSAAAGRLADLRRQQRQQPRHRRLAHRHRPRWSHDCALLGAVYAPHLHTLLAQAEHDIATDRPVVDALADQVRALARQSRRHRGLTAAFVAAALDYAIRVRQPADPADDADPRALAPLPAALHRLIECGQATRELHPYPSAVEISAIIVNLLLLRSINRDESPEATAELLLTILFGALRPELLAQPSRAP
jgi:hypothetical protein